jgi:hypothetical protein
MRWQGAGTRHFERAARPPELHAEPLSNVQYECGGPFLAEEKNIFTPVQDPVSSPRIDQ